ncbi:MAG: MFS transporter [Pseudomonadota bacterium]
MNLDELRSWLSLAGFSVLLFLITAVTYSSLGVVLPHMVQEMNWSWASAGLGFTLLGACCGASSFLPAYLIRKVGVRATILLGSAVMVAGFACLATTHGLPLYFVGAALLGVGYQAMALIPGTHVLGALFKGRARVFSIYFTSGSLGGIAGPFMVLGVMAQTGDQWRLFWIVMAVASIAVGLVCAALVGGREWLAKAAEDMDAEIAADNAKPDTAPRFYRTTRDWTVKEAVRTPQFYILMAAYFMHLLGAVTVASLSVAHLTQIGVAAAVAGTLLSFESFASTASRILGGVFGEKVDPRHVLIGTQAVMAVGLAVLSIAGGSLLLQLLYAVGTGFGFGGTVLAVTMLLMNYYGRKNYLELFSLTCMIGAVSALGPFIGGLIRDNFGSFAPTFQLFSGVSVVVCLAAVVMRPPRHPAEVDAVDRRPAPASAQTLQAAE